MKCHFCQKIFSAEEEEEYQLHQLESCPAILNEDFVVQKPIEVTIRWKKENPSNDTGYVHLMMSDMENEIKMEYWPMIGEFNICPSEDSSWTLYKSADKWK